MAGITDETRDAINAALRNGRKIEAIKLYRDATGEGLKEAKDFVEQLQNRLHEEQPDEFPDSPKQGCAAVLIFLIVVVGTVTVVGRL